MHASYSWPASPSSRTSSAGFDFRPSSAQKKGHACIWLQDCRPPETPSSDEFFCRTDRIPLTCLEEHAVAFPHHLGEAIGQPCVVARLMTENDFERHPLEEMIEMIPY